MSKFATPPEAFGLPKAPTNALEEGLQYTEFLKGSLQIVRRAFLQVGRLLVEVREKKLYAAMGHPDMESYAAERLRLGRSSLYSYLSIFDWVTGHHPEWIDAEPGVFVPDLNDAMDLMHMEGRLKDPNLKGPKRAALENLRDKGLKGKLRKTDLAAFRKETASRADAWGQYLARLRADRRNIARLKGVPEEVLIHLDSAITLFAHAQPLSARATIPPAPRKS